jgi:hypothetical protein
LARSLRIAVSLALVIGWAPAPTRSDEENLSALKKSPKGWNDLFENAGKKLQGWTRGPLLSKGQFAPLSDESQWSLDPKTHVLVCSGEGGHDWLRWDKELGDFVYHVEWRFTPEPGKKGKYNSGIFVRNSADALTWHKVQTGDASGGYLFGDTPISGKLGRINLSKQILDQRVKPAGEWNTFEITCKKKDITIWANGGVTCEWHDCEVAKGYVGLEAEGWRIEFRNVKVKPL